MVRREPKVGDLVRLREFSTAMYKDWHNKLGVVVGPNYSTVGVGVTRIKRLDTGEEMAFSHHEYDLAEEQTP